MNKADSERLATALEGLGLSPITRPTDADVVVLNSCVVRQSAEDKVVGTLNMMKSLKKRKEGQVLALMGCMVGHRTEELEARFSHVDVFMRPQEYSPLLNLLGRRMDVDAEGCISDLTPVRPDVSSYVPVIHGCDLMCTFCIIPFRRGRQVSRPIPEIVREVQLMAARGMREVTLLGQTVDAYGHDLQGSCDLSDLLQEVSKIPDILRLRFLTSHPIFMTDRIIGSINDIDKVCEHINLPIQAADDQVLAQMRRRYSKDDYMRLIEHIRCVIPNVSLATDVIVGFPGETRAQFERTLDIIREVEFHKVHVATYSPRIGTYAERNLIDNVSKEEKLVRLHMVEEAQKDILSRNNSRLVGDKLEVLVDGSKKGKWQGRTRSDKLVFFSDQRNLLGELVNIQINSASPWALQGLAVN